MIETILCIVAAFWLGCAAGSYASERRFVTGRRLETDRIWREYREADRDG